MTGAVKVPVIFFCFYSLFMFYFLKFIPSLVYNTEKEIEILV